MKIPFLFLLQRKRFYFSLAIAGFLLFTYDALTLRENDSKFQSLLNRNPLGYRSYVHYYKEAQRRLRYVEVGGDSLPLIVFIHGAPSSSAFWRNLLTDSALLRRARLLAVDRPGYGYSGYGRPETSVKEQARLIAQVLKEKRDTYKKIIIHGSSYGGTVAARLAMDYPYLVDGLLLQSASVEPGAEKTYDITYPTSHWLIEWLIPGSLKVANHEKLSHRQQLEYMRPLWHRITSPTIILQGDQDDLIYPSNATYAERQLTNADWVEKIIARGSAHNLLWTRRELLVASLLKLLGDANYTNLNAFND